MRKSRKMLAGAGLLIFTVTAFAGGFFSTQSAAASSQECDSTCLCFDYQAYTRETSNPICNGTSPICYRTGLECAAAGGEPDDMDGECIRRCYFPE
jgi:hypothetical protein